MRQIFRKELQRVGVEGAKVLLELGNKVKSMTKLSSTDMLLDVHEAAEELQKKIDQRSYLLVNAELWEIGKRHDGPEEDIDGTGITEGRHKPHVFKSQSEAILDLSSLHISKSWDVHNNIGYIPPPEVPIVPPEALFKQQISWPARSFNIDDVVHEEESRTYESASALSLATFASLLIEFVARLQNLVNAFEELSEKAKFKHPVDEPNGGSASGLWSRIKKFFCF